MLDLMVLIVYITEEYKIGYISFSKNWISFKRFSWGI